jgi:NAD(P)-dependent dehydrogenase (short-subunit alcohol dehydrogenase family)
LVSRDSANLAHAVQAIKAAHHITPEIIEADLSLPGSAEALFQKVGEVDVLVNNAGAIPGGNIHDITEERWRQAWDLKLYSYINLTRAYLPSMEKRGKGVIANIIGMAGAAPRYEYICGSAANAALMLATTGWANAYARRGVRVNGINPGQTFTGRLQGRMQALAQQENITPAQAQERSSTELPMGRFSQPHEIANMVVFLCAAQSSYVNGALVAMDGALTPVI